MGKKHTKFGGIEFIEEESQAEGDLEAGDEEAEGFEEFEDGDMMEEGESDFDGEDGEEGEIEGDEEGLEGSGEFEEDLEGSEGSEEQENANKGFITEYTPEGEGEEGNDAANGTQEDKQSIREKLRKKLEELKGKKSLKDLLQEKRNRLLKKTVSTIKCRERRLKVLDKRQHELQMIENKRRRELRKQNKADPANIMKPITIEDAREVGKSFLFNQQQEVDEEEAIDEFSALFNQEKTPKILITTDEKPTRHIFEFIKELRELIPNSLSKLIESQ